MATSGWKGLSGIYSTIINFTVHDFLRRARRLSLLNDIKCKQLNDESVNNLVFPIHYKHRNDPQSLLIQSQTEIDQIDIEQVITDAYHKAIDMPDGLEILNFTLICAKISIKKDQLCDKQEYSKGKNRVLGLE
ncbi:unnamed protein product [Didymodactylos carnosus]|uniref:Uncharacterized protein n=1 Tax=Didymodactylos carnosus TaxID=1234261 RepID=A0A8S2YMX2_9BILA|nr:unnamed protein product [Didymodactylos carnosus]